jgi:hypothetical protein
MTVGRYERRGSIGPAGVIQKTLETELGFQLTRREVRDGQRVLVDYDRDGKKLVFNPQPSPVCGEGGCSKSLVCTDGRQVS